MTRPAWQSLLAVHWRRTRPALLGLLLSMGPLTLLFAHRAGYRTEDVLTYITLICAVIPITASGAVIKGKVDGSLAFIAGLPVSAGEHVRAWFVLVALLALPLSVSVTTAMIMLPFGVPVVAAPAVTVTTFAFTVSITMAQLAVQLSKPPTGSAPFLFGVMSVGIMGLFALEQLYRAAPALFQAVLRSPLFLPALSVGLWLIVAATFWRSCDRIGHYMTSYVGEPPAA